MGRFSSIEWTHHTFNPWWGCQKVSPACENCYAESWAKRVGHDLWGKSASRRFFGDAHWSEPLKWNRDAEAIGERQRVFCASMADVFEARKELSEYRERLWTLIEATPMLDWLLLTKRPQNITKMVPWKSKLEWPANVWVGTTVENQKEANRRLSHLLKIPAAIRFLSCEPLLGKLDLSSFSTDASLLSIDWIIAGGESGAKARPMNPVWLRTLRDFAKKKKIAFHFKQWGHWAPLETEGGKQGKMISLDGHLMAAVGKIQAGRVLDGTTWDGVPSAMAA